VPFIRIKGGEIKPLKNERGSPFTIFKKNVDKIMNLVDPRYLSPWLTRKRRESPPFQGWDERRLWYNMIGMKALGLDRSKVTPLEREIPR